jgi:hypothetical protein
MKYSLSLCCIIKDENYLEEFIIYYTLLGVEHFYIYDNESNYKISERLNHYYFKRICTIIDFPGKIQQLNAYNHYLKHYGHETKWLIIVDGDEYILPKKAHHKSIKDFLKDYKDYHAIGINWVMFGTSFHDKIQQGLLIDNYRYSEGIQNKHIKTICKPEFVINIESPHYVILKDPTKYVDPHKRIISGSFNTLETIDIIQINHYWGKSVEEHYEKRDRGRATTNSKRIIVDDPHLKYNNIIDNMVADIYLEKLKKIYFFINLNLDVYKLLNTDLIFNSNEEYYDHLINNGFSENRNYKLKDLIPDFNHNIYLKKNPDLVNKDNNELEIHFLNFGMREGRIYK